MKSNQRPISKVSNPTYLANESHPCDRVPIRLNILSIVKHLIGGFARKSTRHSGQRSSFLALFFSLERDSIALKMAQKRPHKRPQNGILKKDICPNQKEKGPKMHPKKGPKIKMLLNCAPALRAGPVAVAARTQLRLSVTKLLAADFARLVDVFAEFLDDAGGRFNGKKYQLDVQLQKRLHLSYT